jgi:hypothetical protein
LTSFTWTFITDIPNPVGDDFSLWACSRCGAVVPGTHERVHLQTHTIVMPQIIDRSRELPTGSQVVVADDGTLIVRRSSEP